MTGNQFSLVKNTQTYIVAYVLCKLSTNLKKHHGRDLDLKTICPFLKMNIIYSG